MARPGTVGRALDGVTLLIRDETGQPCPPGVAGDICVMKMAQPNFTYHGDDSKRRAIESDGGLVTGDIGYLDEEGYLFICDRRTDMIISGGVNIYPAEVEAALMNIPGVRDCAVIGIPDPEFGEAVMAFVEPQFATPPGGDEILDALRTRLAGYKLPRRIEFCNALPRDDSGKIYKRRLREHLLAPGAG